MNAIVAEVHPGRPSEDGPQPTSEKQSREIHGHQTGIDRDQKVPNAAAGASQQGDLDRLLPLVLRALNWQRSERVMRSAIGEPGPLTEAGLVQALRRLGFEVSVTDQLPERWELGIDAALIRVGRDGAAQAQVRRSGVTTTLTPDGESAEWVAPGFRTQRYLLIVDVSGAAVQHRNPTFAWTPNLRRVTRTALWLSFFINLLALTVPIFSMQIYDRVIGGNAPEVLPWFAIGSVLAIGLMLVLRRQRSRLLAGAHARVGYHLALAVMDRMLRLPLLVAGKLRRASIVSRVRELERIRDRLSAANTIAVFDAPFILLSLAAVVFVGGWLVLVPVIYLGLFALVAHRVSDYVAAGSRAGGPAIAERDALLSDLAENAPALLASQTAEGWSRRFLEVSAEAVRGSYVQGVRLGLAQSAAYVLGTGAALATLVIGLELVLAGLMTTGGLIASMLLIWRITAPAQSLFLSIGRLKQVDTAKAQVERFFNSPYDGNDAAKRMPPSLETPNLVFERVSFRYGSDQEPALAGVSFRLEPGEMLVLVGPNGAGKTTLLRLAAGLLEPQGGLILIGERNLKQFDPEDLRLVLGYYTESPATFTATVAENLRAAAPGASDAVLQGCVKLAWPGDAVAHLSEGLQTRLPLSESKGLALEDDQRVGLARVMLKPKPLLLIADPVENAGPDAPKQVRAFVDEAKAFIQATRGKSTIIFATQNPDLIGLADKALILDRGQVVHFGPLQKPEAAVANTDIGPSS